MVPLLILYFRNNINDFVTLHVTMAMFKVIKRYIKVMMFYQALYKGK